MAYLLCICVFALLSTVYSQMMTMDQPLACPENEIYHSCVSEVCHKTCDDMNYPPATCPMLQVDCNDPGCICEVGFLRNRRGKCVRTYDCDWPIYTPTDPDPLDCPSNERYYRCSSEVCHKTCQDMRTPPATCPVPELGCVERACLCEVGFLRDDTGRCVPLYECP